MGSFLTVFQVVTFIIMAAIVAGGIITLIVKLFSWSENNHAEITEHKALLIKKQTNDRVYRNTAVGTVGGIPVRSTLYYLTFRLENGKKRRYSVNITDSIKAKEGDRGTLKLKGTRFVSFERDEG